MKVWENRKKTQINIRIYEISRLNKHQFINIPFLYEFFYVVIFINKNASKFFTLFIFYIFFHLYNGIILERFTKSKE